MPGIRDALRSLRFLRTNRDSSAGAGDRQRKSLRPTGCGDDYISQRNDPAEAKPLHNRSLIRGGGGLLYREKLPEAEKAAGF